jgi:hypothetical protein
MKGLKKFLTGLMVIFLSLFLIGAGYFFYYLYDLSKYQQAVNQDLSMLLGHNTMVHGGIKWVASPHIGLKISNVTTYDGMHQELLHVDSATAILNLVALAKGKLEIKTLDIDSVDVRLPWPMRAHQFSKKQVNHTHRLRDLEFISKRVDIDAVNFHDIYFHFSGATFHINKLQAMNVNVGKPFPFFAYAHMRETHKHAISQQRFLKLHSGKIKGFITLPHVEHQASGSELHQAHAFGDFRSERFKFLRTYGKGLQGTFKLRSGKFSIEKLSFYLGDGKVTGQGSVKAKDELIMETKVDLTGNNIDVSKLGTAMPLVKSGKMSFSLDLTVKQKIPTVSEGVYYQALSYENTSKGVFQAVIKDAELHQFNLKDWSDQLEKDLHKMPNEEVYTFKIKVSEATKSTKGHFLITSVLDSTGDFDVSFLHDVPQYQLRGKGKVIIAPLMFDFKADLAFIKPETIDGHPLLKQLDGHIPLDIGVVEKQDEITFKLDMDKVKKVLYPSSSGSDKNASKVESSVPVGTGHH